MVLNLSNLIFASLQVTGQSYILWAIENYGPMCKLSDDIVAKEGEIKVFNILSRFSLSQAISIKLKIESYKIIICFHIFKFN